MTDLSDYVSVGFTTRPASQGGRKTDLEFRFEKAGIADPTKTQLILRLKSPFRRPEWLQDLQDGRSCRKNRSHHIARLYGVSLVLKPLNPNTSIQEV